MRTARTASEHGVATTVGLYDERTFETGLLREGDANPAHDGYDSLADYCFGDDFVEVRLPWQLLNFSNPAEMQVHDDYYQQYGVENLAIESIYVGTAVGDGPASYLDSARCCSLPRHNLPTSRLLFSGLWGYAPPLRGSPPRFYRF